MNWTEALKRARITAVAYDRRMKVRGVRLPGGNWWYYVGWADS